MPLYEYNIHMHFRTFKQMNGSQICDEFYRCLRDSKEFKDIHVETFAADLDEEGTPIEINKNLLIQ